MGGLIFFEILNIFSKFNMAKIRDLLYNFNCETNLIAIFYCLWDTLFKLVKLCAFIQCSPIRLIGFVSQARSSQFSVVSFGLRLFIWKNEIIS